MQGRNYVIQQIAAIDLTNTGATVAMANFYVPATGAQIVEAMFVGSTAGGFTTSGTHQVAVQSAAGVDITNSTTFSCDLAAGTVGGIATNNGVSAGDKGTEIQLIWTEAGTVTNGAIVDVHVIWAL
jgi:hypothetical protein